LKDLLLPRTPIGPRFFARDVDLVARSLIGTTLLVNGVGGRIVETESYDRHDPASHSYEGRKTPRNTAMFAGPGHAYVYRSYGIHWCLNFVCGEASAVLIRAIEPLAGIETMQRRRGTNDIRLLCSGPGRLCTALAVSGTMTGNSLYAPPFALFRGKGDPEISVGVRIGLTRAADRLRRFGLAQSRFLSRRFPDAEA
jgi:DNA-3-methyladenine glycosylase